MTQTQVMTLQIYTVQTAPPYIWLHVASAASSIFLGGWLLIKRKGTEPHRWLGRLWVGPMLFTSIGSFQIQASGHLSWLHGLSILSFFAVTAAVVGALKHNRELHRKSMIGAYTGLVLPGIFTLLPYRMLGQFLFGAH